VGAKEGLPHELLDLSRHHHQPLGPVVGLARLGLGLGELRRRCWLLLLLLILCRRGLHVGKTRRGEDEPNPHHPNQPTSKGK
jgi:hypothetical protein